MTAPQRWLLALLLTAVAVVMRCLWLDRPLALLVHAHSAQRETFARLTYIPDLLLPLAVAFVAFGRLWPDIWVQNNPSFIHDGAYGFIFFHGGASYASFPSGHTATTCAVISVLWIKFPKLRPVYALVVLAVAVGLIGTNYYFLSDVIAAGFVGSSTGWMTAALWQARQSRDAFPHAHED